AAGARADAAGVAAGVRLRQGERAQLAVGEGAAHVALLLPRVAVRQDRGHGQRGGGPGREEAGAAPGDLLGEDALLEQAEAGAAELLRHVAVEEPQIERLLDRRGRELAGLVVAGGDRADHLGGEPARGVPHRHLLLAEGEPDHTRSPLRRILPDGLVGISSTISTRRGSLKIARCWRRYAISSGTRIVRPGSATRKACGASPVLSSFMRTTAQRATPG